METTAISTKNTPFFQTSGGKFLGIFIIVVVLSILLGQIYFLYYERSERFIQAKSSLHDSWGGQTSINGLQLRVPIEHKGKITKVLAVNPNKQNIDIQTIVDKKKRGIYWFPVFNCTAKIKATVAKKDLPKMANLNKIRFGIKDGYLGKLEEISDIKVNGKALEINKSLTENAYRDFFSSEEFTFDGENALLELTVKFRGAEHLQVFCKGENTNVRISSNWDSPSFKGDLLPKLGEKTGGNLFWTASFSHRDFGFSTASSNPKTEIISVDFMQPVDHYSMFSRTLKYAVLIVILTFGVFFISEYMNKQNLNFLHYLMIGLALIAFFFLLLAFSEHVGFSWAYLIASTSVVLTNFWYIKSLLKNRKFTLITISGMASLYSILYFLINLETYAFLAGSIFLFLVLICVMAIVKKFLEKPDFT